MEVYFLLFCCDGKVNFLSTFWEGTKVTNPKYYKM